MKPKLKGLLSVITVLIAIMLLSVAIDFISAFVIPKGPNEEESVEERACILPNVINDQRLRLSTRCIPCEENSPIFKVIGVPNTRYLRVVVEEIYENGLWKSGKNTPLLRDKVLYIQEEVYEFSTKLKGNIVIKPLIPFDGYIPTILYTTRLESQILIEYYRNQQVFYAEESFNSSYTVEYEAFYYKDELLKTAKLVVDEAYLQLTNDITDRVKSLANNITASFQHPYEKLAAIETYLRTHYNYTKEFEPAPSDHDPVDWFLFIEKKGVCIHFNTAFVILARCSGIPARLVGGYLIDPNAENQTVYAKQRHAYAEVKFEGLGWVPFDATPFGGTCRCGEEQANGEGQEQANGEGQKGDLIPVEGVMPPYVPLFHILGIPETSYLRTAIGEKYEYGAWYIDKDAQTLSYKGENLAIEVAKFTLSSQGMIRIVPEQTIRGFIPTVLYVNNLRFYGNLEYYPKQQTFFIDQDYNSTYKVFFTVYYFNGYLLKNAELVIDNDYLQLPDNITNRTKELAYSITQGIETPYQKICALESYLRQNYEYDIDYNRAPDGWEPIDWFLFEEKKGVCTQFNTALAILARSVGIPCRVVVGYLIDAHAEKQTVYADQAHLYVEVGFRELGWVQFDATPSGACRCRLSDLLQDKIKTFTKITEASMVGVKGHEFYVQGTVVDERGERVSGLAVLIYLKRFPSEEGTLCGSGIIKGGEFKITCKTPIEVDIGNYWIIAHTIGNEEYMDSWSEDIPSLGAWATVIPNIDGILSSEEWSDASSKEFILNIQGEVKRAQIFVKNDRTNLYIMLVIFDINYSPNDCVWFIFDNDNDGISEDKDDLLFITASGTYADCYLSVYDASYLRVFDNSDDGTNDLMASVRHTKRYDVGDYVFELSRPLNSFDIKHDFVLPLDNKIQFRLEFNYTFNGGYYSISWPCPSVFAEIKAIAPRLSTFTEMTSASQTCARGDVFYAEGKVIDQNGLRVDGLTVKVYLKRSKESNDSILCGIGTVESGFFRIICKAPSDLIVGDYFLVAQTIENDRYEGSWSDPPIKIMARTELVLSAPREVAVGRTFTIHGGLVENETGQSIPSETVTLCLGSEKLIDLLTDENGQFEFSYTIYEPGNYTFNVVFLGSDYYFGSESAVIIKVLLPSFIINTNNVLVRLKNYDISGRVFIGDSPLAYTQISIFFDGKPIATVNCDNEGSFKVKYTIPPVQNLGNALINYTLVQFGVSQLQNVTVYANTYIQFKAPTLIYPKDVFEIKGILSDDLGSPLRNARLILIHNYNGGNETLSSVSNFKGESFFNASLPLTYMRGNFTFIILFEGKDFYLPSSIEGKIPLKATETQIICKSPESISAGEPFKMVATLQDGSGNPISDAKLLLKYEVEGKHESRESITNGTGQAVFSITLPNNFQAPNLGFVIAFEGSGFYKPSQTSGQIRVLIPSFLGQFLLPLTFSVLIGTGTAIMLYFMRKRLTDRKGSSIFLKIGQIWRNKKRFTEKTDSLATGDKSPALSQRLSAHEGKMDRMKTTIEFPDIKHPLPDTWGIGEPLKIKSRLLDSDGTAVEGAQLKLIINGGEPITTTTDNSGEVAVIKTFEEKGSHKIEVSYQDEGELEASSAERVINIIDYREEIINLFNARYKTFQTQGVNLDDQTTPREMQLKTLETLKDIDKRALEELVSVFEVAEYSPYSVGREHYEKAYLSILLIDLSLKGKVK